MNKASLDGLWKHVKSGNNYRVLAVSNTSAEESRKKKDHPITVFYQDSDGEIWSKTIEHFLESFEVVTKQRT